MINKLFKYMYSILFVASSFAQDVETQQSVEPEDDRLNYVDFDTLTKKYINTYYDERERERIKTDQQKMAGIDYICTRSYKILSPQEYTIDNYLKIDIEKLAKHREFDESVEYQDPETGFKLLLYSHQEMRIHLGRYREYNIRINQQ